MARREGAKEATAATSTAAVLWLMILLVFLPIAGAHLLARQLADPPAAAPASVTRPDGAAPGAG